MNTGYFLDIDVKREEAARYGLTIEDVQDVIQSAIGGTNITTTIEGRERYPVNVRYSRDFRGDIEKLKRVLVPVQLGSNATQIPLGELADLKIVKGPTVIKSEEGTLVLLCLHRLFRQGCWQLYRRGQEALASLKDPRGIPA